MHVKIMVLIGLLMLDIERKCRIVCAFVYCILSFYLQALSSFCAEMHLISVSSATGERIMFAFFGAKVSNAILSK